MTEQNTNINRRPPPTLPHDLSNLSWALARAPIHRALLWAIQFYSSIPGGFKNILPTTIQAGVAAFAGTQKKGWTPPDHIHPIETAAPDPLTLGQASAVGTSTSLVRADGHPETITLLAQVRREISRHR